MNASRETSKRHLSSTCTVTIVTNMFALQTSAFRTSVATRLAVRPRARAPDTATRVISTMSNKHNSLFTKTTIGSTEVGHRVVMAPLTRNRADPETFIPNEMMKQYYEQRSSPGGLIICEATQISQEGQGYPLTPGIYTDAQVEGWKAITDAVHAKGGRMFCQLWHVGRISHPSHQPNGALPVAPSAVAPEGMDGGYVATRPLILSPRIDHSKFGRLSPSSKNGRTMLRCNDSVTLWKVVNALSPPARELIQFCFAT